MRRPARRARTVAAVVALVLAAGSGAASAQLNVSPKMTGSVTSPGEGHVADRPSVTVAGQFEYGQDLAGDLGEVTEVEITLIPDRGQQLPDGASTVVRAANPERTLPFSWATPALPWNGPYTARVVAKGEPRIGSPQTSPPLDRHFSLAAPPLRPVNVKVVDAGDAGVTVSWARNPEPDLVLYEVRRAAAGKDFAPVAQTTAGLTTLTDKPGLGDWRYVVVAIRRGADDDTGVASAPSAEGSVSIAPPTTVPAPGDTGGGTGTDGAAAAGATGTASTPGAAGGGPGSGSTRVDLSGFSTQSSGSRPAARRISPDDGGFAPTLPFATPDPAATDTTAVTEPPPEPVVEQAVEPLTSDDAGERRRSLSFVAGGLLLFVMSMSLLWIRGEVRRADELEALDPEPFPAPDPDATLDDLAVPGPGELEWPYSTAAFEPDAGPEDRWDAPGPPAAPAAPSRRRGGGGRRAESAFDGDDLGAGVRYGDGVTRYDFGAGPLGSGPAADPLDGDGGQPGRDGGPAGDDLDGDDLDGDDLDGARPHGGLDGEIHGERGRPPAAHLLEAGEPHREPRRGVRLLGAHGLRPAPAQPPVRRGAAVTPLAPEADSGPDDRRPDRAAGPGPDPGERRPDRAAGPGPEADSDPGERRPAPSPGAHGAVPVPLPEALEFEPERSAVAPSGAAGTAAGASRAAPAGRRPRPAGPPAGGEVGPDGARRPVHPLDAAGPGSAGRRRRFGAAGGGQAGGGDVGSDGARRGSPHLIGGEVGPDGVRRPAHLLDPEPPPPRPAPRLRDRPAARRPWMAPAPLEAPGLDVPDPEPREP